jgi:bifunctional UDP-N-acetylglucosamine pyrophosphorylase/glucosamine-1-phosphate N-acetyltransferase
VEDVLILNGDVPAMSAGLLQRFIDLYRHQERDVGVLAFRAPDPTGYGRIINDDEGHVIAIREEQELADDQRSIDIVNAGIYLAKVHHLAAFLEQVKPSPNQREFLLTDLVEYIVAQGGRADVLVAPDAEEVAGVNDRVQLAEADARLRQRRNRELMKTGVGMPHPESVDVEEGIEVGPDTVLEAGVVLRGATCLGSGCTIGIGSVIEDTRIADNVIVKPYCVLESSIIDSECVLGPFAHTRPGTVLNRKAKVGNFVETKKTVLGEGSKASHLTYLGDATIGKGVNIGAGTITCNYDGYKKYPTVIEDGAFVGSDTQFVAPVRIGTDAVVGAGTTVTRDVPAGALAVSRMKQENKDGYVARKKDRMTTAGKE